MSGGTEKKYRVSVDALEDGHSCHLGTITVDADCKEDAQQQGYDQLWDSRLDIAGNSPRIDVQELDVDDF